jgi:hypothetical protein
MLLDLDRKSWRERGMKAPCPYDAGPPVKTRFTTFAAGRFNLEICPRADNRRLRGGAELCFRVV